MQENKLGSEEFYQVILDLTSQKILPDSYIEKYPDLIENIIFDMWLQYYQNEFDMGVRPYAVMLESFFYNLFQFESSSERTEDEIHL